MRFRQSLSTIHILTIAITAFVVMAAVGAYDLIQSVHSQRERYTALREQTIDTIESGLAQAVWHIDHDATLKILRGALQFDYIRRVEVVDPSGRIFAAIQSNDHSSKNWLGRFLFEDIEVSERPLHMTVQRRRGEQNEYLGDLRLYLDVGFAGQSFRGYVLSNMSKQAVVLVLLAALATAVTHRVLTRPLRRLARDVEGIDPATPTTRFLEADPFHRQNEIGTLVNRFNDLLSRVQESQALREEVIRQQYNRQFLVELNERLENKITERTRELEREKSHAEVASRSKSIFLANMSHELRTPLNGVIGYAEVIKDEVMGPIRPKVYRTYGEHIHTSGQHMLELIEEVLSLSETEFGQAALEEAEFDIRDEIDRTVTNIRPRASNRGIKLVAQMPRRRVWLRADPRRFRQMLLNLISNAIKYTAPGGHVEVFVRVEPGGGVAVAVEDNGQGIEPERVREVVKPFHNTQDPTHSRDGGLGLGLPLTKRIMEAHGGSLELRSTLGKGTLALLLFPSWRRCEPCEAAGSGGQQNTSREGDATHEA